MMVHLKVYVTFKFLYGSMLIVCISCLFYLTGICQGILKPPYQADESKLIQCLIDILKKYFSEDTELTYTQIEPDEDELLKEIHASMKFSLISRQAVHQMSIPNQGYLISSGDVTTFTQHFDYLLMEAAWNPNARFLIVIEIVRADELKLVFDELLTHHVNNVVVVNGTEVGYVYSYNPFENYACGRYYDTIISYGECSQVTKDLYPNKLVTALKNCSFRALVPHRPPYSIDPLWTDDKYTLLGTEEYIITLLGKADQFNVSFTYIHDSEEYSVVAPNMTAFGPMEMLQNGDCDIVFGGIMLVSSRVEAFSYLYGYLDYIDELRFAVKSSKLVPTWQYIYLEFELEVWAVLLVSFAVYSIIVIILLRSKDKGEIVLRLLDNLLLHGREIRTRFSVRCVLIIWVWFAYLINTFYQSNLFSLTTEPSMDFQISNEEHMIEYNLKPCFSEGLQKYLFSETGYSDQNGLNWEFNDKRCRTIRETMETIIRDENLFTLIPSYVYLYNEANYNDEWGDSLIYYFDKPYAKFLFGYYFYKGFPITQSLQLNALRMRESGLAEKRLRDHYYRQRLKNKFSEKSFQARFLFPWRLCIPGFIVAITAFIIELLIEHLYCFRH